MHITKHNPRPVDCFSKTFVNKFKYKSILLDVERRPKKDINTYNTYTQIRLFSLTSYKLCLKESNKQIWRKNRTDQDKKITIQIYRIFWFENWHSKLVSNFHQYNCGNKICWLQVIWQIIYFKTLKWQSSIFMHTNC